ncbi:hypothetical protein LTR62_005543 [Meristemomyces frigidus]|uniref:Uncharacterized protein n=1 Tax=Meristemomyces frigidus TaxID=1508187 RepID=A0AAN7TEF4_9PEZI|nr:hypothetical protein LTR62_005543 [Meristemomyces frigidus]
MDDFTLQSELEAMAGNAGIPLSEDQEIPTEGIGTTMARWRKLFDMKPDDAVERIIEHRQNLTRLRVSNDHWETIRAEKENQGYDRESYEYELALQKKKALLPTLSPVVDETTGSTVTYFVELDGHLSTPQDVQKAAGMDYEPLKVAGSSVEDDRGVRPRYSDGPVN